MFCIKCPRFENTYIYLFSDHMPTGFTRKSDHFFCPSESHAPLMQHLDGPSMISSGQFDDAD